VSEQVRSFPVDGWTCADAVVAKGNRHISVCIPCRNEAGTVGHLVRAISDNLCCDLVDELVVIDDNSTDGTGKVAAAAGATVVHIDDIHRVYGEGRGKGNVLWSSLAASTGDFVVWCDGDVTTFTPDWVVRLLKPLLVDDSVALVKAHYERPDDLGGGGRTTELVARPLLSLFFPELSGLYQPLSGEYACRRSVIETLPFVQGWGVEVALLIDLAERFGPSCIAQVDVGVRRHRHQNLRDLSVQAAEVMATLLSRTPATAAFAEALLTLHRPDGDNVVLNLDERPPMATVRAAIEARNAD
jgi:glucosyl-3-phosphoglycerate synthase